VTNILATREGRIGQKTASGYIVDPFVPFVALPDEGALRMVVRLTSHATGRSLLALVLDVGPWNTHDATYVFGGERPQAESGVDLFGRTTNHAGIDLGEYAWKFLKMTDNAPIDWEFVR